MPGVAFCQAFNTEDETFKKAVLNKGLFRVVRTGGLETAMRAHQGANHIAIKAQGPEIEERSIYVLLALSTTRFHSLFRQR